MRPGYRSIFRPFDNRGRGECRVPNAPAASCALGVVSMRTSVHSGGTGNIRHSPRNGLNGFLRALPGDEFLFATVTPQIEWHLEIPVGPRVPPQGLASATDARTTRLRRTQQCRSSCAPIIAHEALSPPCDISCARDIVASTASHPNVRDDREPPLLWSGMAKVVNLIWVFRKAIYFSRGDWTGIRDDSPSGKSVDGEAQ
jgi:hypothetical protein